MEIAGPMDKAQWALTMLSQPGVHWLGNGGASGIDGAPGSGGGGGGAAAGVDIPVLNRSDIGASGGGGGSGGCNGIGGSGAEPVAAPSASTSRLKTGLHSMPRVSRPFATTSSLEGSVAPVAEAVLAVAVVKVALAAPAANAAQRMTSRWTSVPSKQGLAVQVAVVDMAAVVAAVRAALVLTSTFSVPVSRVPRSPRTMISPWRTTPPPVAPAAMVEFKQHRDRTGWCRRRWAQRPSALRTIIST